MPRYSGSITVIPISREIMLEGEGAFVGDNESA